jgi:glycosyltransferase involved in cell wall biosynthesis
LSGADGPTVLMVAAMGFPAGQGSQVYVGGMCRALVAAGCRVRLATYGHGDGRWPEGVERVPVRRVPWQTLTSGPHPSKALQDAALVEGLVRALRRERVDVVHAHHVEAPALARLAMRVAGVRRPLVINPHTSLAEELPTYLPTWVPSRWTARAGEATDRAIAGLGDAGVALSPRAAALLRSWGATRVLEVAPGVDPDELRGGDAARAVERWSLVGRSWVVYAGTTDAFQDLDVLVAAVARLPEAGLLVVSAGDASSIEGMGRSAGLSASRLRVVSGASFADTKDALAAAAVCALPRRRCAGFPMKVLNHLMLGKVTVAAAESAPPLEGVLPVPGGDVAAMAGALQAVLDDPEAAADLGAAGRRAALARHGWPSAARRLRGLYEELCE